MHRPRRTPSAPALDLPPPFRLVTLREVGDAFAHAQAIASDEGAMTAGKALRLKPQNLIAGLPVRRPEAVS